MPVSETRLREILELSNDERVHHLDTSNFNEADWQRLDAELTEETLAFCRETKDPEELHAFASTWNWDKGIWALREIVDNAACEAATALLIYWRARPEFFLRYADRDAVAAEFRSGLESFDFLSAIETRYVAGEFRNGFLNFDPADPTDNLVGVYDDDRSKFVRILPALMYIPVGMTG